MTLAAILEQAGFVPAVPAMSRSIGTPESKAQCLAPIVPAVPAQEREGGTVPAARLLSIADAEMIDPELVHRLPADVVEICTGLAKETLRAYLRALRDTALRERGNVPGDETAAALCRHCGPIWLHPAVARVVPVVDGWPRVLGCPWCHVRNREVVPHPKANNGE
jgi:hypothetical protein